MNKTPTLVAARKALPPEGANSPRGGPSGNWMWLKFAVLNTLRNRRRSLVTVSIAALGTAGILLAGGFALFTYESLAEASARDSGHLVIGKPDQFVRDEETPLQHGLDDAAKLRAQLMIDPQVRAVLRSLR